MTNIALMFIALGALMTQASARGQAPAPHRDEAVVLEQMRTMIRFENDGTGRREVFIRAKAQNEAGVRELGQLVFGYNASTERLDVAFVRVRKPDGSAVATPASAVQDLSSPVQRVAPVYTDFRQKHVTVQGLAPGDTLEASIVTVVHTALAPGHFWIEYRFNTQAIVLDEQLDIDVPAARPVLLKQLPGFAATTVTADGRRRYHWAHANTVRTKPDESDAKKVDDADAEHRSPVRLTSFPDWAAVGAWFAGLERPARAVSPEISAKARELTAGRTTELEKLEALYDYVSKSFRYVSLSLGMGRYQPRTAADVMREGYGDCKDKHALLAALIEAAGLQASPVLMNSRTRIDPEFPSPSQFDHVITLARAGDQDVWLDATPEIAPFQMLQYSLRGKDGLLATPGTGILKGTPADAPIRSLMRTDVDGSLAANGTLAADVRLTFRGDIEVLLRSAFHATARSNWDDIVTGMSREAGVTGRVSAVTVSDPQATKEPFSLSFHVDAEQYASIAGRREDLLLPFAEGDDEQAPPSESKPIELGQPGQVAYSLALRLPPAARMRAGVPVSVSRDYGSYRATYAVDGDTLRVGREFTLAQRELPQSRRADYLSFKRVLAADAKQRVSVDGTAIAAPAVASDATAPELNRAGYAALEAGDYVRAIDLLKRALALDPKAPNARTNLARAYLERKRPAEALAELRAQIELSPYDEFAYFYAGRAHVALRQYAEAEKTFNKALEINPLDKWAHGELGDIYMDQRQFEKAALSYEKSASVNPEQAYAQIQLGKAYLGLGRADHAMAAFARALELRPGANTWNSVAYALALAGVNLPRAREYAESAVSSESAASRNLSVAQADVRALRVAGSLAAHWDTLGWVHFAGGDLAKAEKYVAAAWTVAQHAEVGDHLGQIYEKTGRKDAAIALYAQALAAPNPQPMVRQHLVALTKDPGSVDALVARHKVDLAAGRTIAIDGKGPAGQKADFLVLFANGSGVEDVSFIEGDAGMQALLPAMKTMKSFAFPDDVPAKLLRRGNAVCNASGSCTLTLVVPDDARAVK